MKLLPSVFSSLNSRVKIFESVVNSVRHFLFLCHLIRDYHASIIRHSPNDTELVPLELIRSSRDTLPNAWEVYLIERGRTLINQRYTQTRRNLTFNPLFFSILLLEIIEFGFRRI